jgi:hypothetical protein
MKIDPELKKFATPRQAECIDAVNEHGSTRAAAKVLGVHHSGIARCIEAVKLNAAKRGYAPDFNYSNPVPEGFRVKGVSQLIDADGSVKQQWVKSEAKKDETALRAAIEEFAAEYEGKAEKTKPPTKQKDSDAHLVVIPLGDPHFGMFAWGEEVGEDFDLKIAETLMRDAVQKLVDLTPPSPVCLIINLGDFFHTDSTENRTRQSGNQLDVDTRQPKILRVGIAAYISAIECALAKHGRIVADTRIGNHDDTSSLMMALVLQAWFRNEPRVEVVIPAGQFYYYQHGQCLLGSTHGHTVKADALPGVMACDRAELWGKTKFRHWYTGHVHHTSIKEYPGCTVETFRTLAGSDSWHHGQGYRSGRDMRADIWHKDYGMVQRFIVGVAQLRK